MMHVVHVNAGNDRNGNPRRAYLIFTVNGRFLFNEGYEGWQAVPLDLRLAYDAGGSWLEMVITPGAYRKLFNGKG